MQDFIKKQIKESSDLKIKLLESGTLVGEVEKAARAIINAFSKGNKLLIAGNGGSAADAQHLAAEFVNRFAFDRKGLPAIALTTDSSLLTSISNDYGFDIVFARQVETLGNEGDIFMGISTSGNSVNIIKALEVCRDKKIITVGLTGQGGQKMKKMCDICVIVPSTNTPRIQEVHLLLYHIICGIVEEEIFGSQK